MTTLSKKETLNMNKFGLQLRKTLSKKVLLIAPIFGEDEEDNDVDKEISRQASKTKSLKKIEEQHKKALEEDPCAFAYDEVYDDTKQEALLPRLHERQECNKPIYNQLMREKADRRQKEREIVYERKLAKERAKEQHLFPDQVKVVTGSYKRKLEERDRWLSEERLRELGEEKDDVTKKKDLSDFYFNIGKNVAFGARDIKAREAERLKEQRKVPKLEKLREKMKTESPERVVLPDSRDIGSSCRIIVELQEAEQVASEKKMNSDATEERDLSIKGAAKDEPRATYQHWRSEDALAAAKKRFLARKKAKIEE
ncbi:hypothetical protein AtNW77_Chr1g0056141 [Arabidopsis thaliana]|uniref:Nuclear speckle splicing regulatory protein 1 N-terminal domain-containing protein n=1 Tax=Arabidopsis thaliana TaxID=3702 RepID=A0A178WKD8_ARATH|nr:hypothetical protein AXX17_AT1G50590 [Arabidopsis thaliana]